MSPVLRRRLRRSVRIVGAVLVLSALPASPPAASAQDSSFGGYEVVATGSGFTVAPSVPAVLPVETPVEGTLALALASLSTGGLGYGLASSAYPGTPITGLRPLLETGAGVALPIPDYPVLVESREHEPPANSRQPGITMRSDVSPEQADVSSDLGGFTIPGVVDIGSVRTNSRSTVGRDGVAATTATEVNGIDLVAGAVRIDTIRTSAGAATDGESATCEGGVVVSGATIGGTPVTIDESGISASGERALPLTDPDAGVQSVLASTGVEVRVLGGGQTCEGTQADRTTSGVLISLPLPAAGPVPPGGRLDIILGSTSARAVVTPAFVVDPTAPASVDLPAPTFSDVVPDVPMPPAGDAGLAPVGGPAGLDPVAGPAGAPPVLAASPTSAAYRFGGLPIGLVAGSMLLAFPGARRIRRYLDRISAIATAP